MTILIEKTPGVVGGRARLAGTRIPVWQLAERRAGGQSAADIASWFPPITVEDVEAAWAYADENRGEIANDIMENKPVVLGTKPKESK